VKQLQSLCSYLTVSLLITLLRKDGTILYRNIFRLETDFVNCSYNYLLNVSLYLCERVRMFCNRVATANSFRQWVPDCRCRVSKSALFAQKKLEGTAKAKFAPTCVRNSLLSELSWECISPTYLLCVKWFVGLFTLEKNPRFTAFLDSNLHTRLAIVTGNELGLAFPPRNLTKKIRPDPSTFYLVIVVTNKTTDRQTDEPTPVIT